MDDALGIPPFCPRYRRAMELIGSRWTGAILRAVLTGETRFARIARAIPGLSDRLLSERLKELEAEGLIVRVVTPSTPVQVEYRPTEKGRSLAGIVCAVAEWAEEWLSGDQPEAEGPRDPADSSGAKNLPV